MPEKVMMITQCIYDDAITLVRTPNEAIASIGLEIGLYHDSALNRLLFIVMLGPGSGTIECFLLKKTRIRVTLNSNVCTVFTMHNVKYLIYAA